jgi:biotin synthase-like enzyme
MYAGANSIFFGRDRLLTTPNPDVDKDRALLRDAGLRTLEPVSG